MMSVVEVKVHGSDSYIVSFPDLRGKGSSWAS